MPADLFGDQPVLTGELVRLEPLTEAVLEDYLVGLADPQVYRLTATHAQFDQAQIEQWLASRAQQHDRADWAVLRRCDEKCGFQLEGRLRQAVRWDGEWHDELVMSVLSTDPRPAGAR